MWEDQGRCNVSLGKLEWAELNGREVWSRGLEREVATKRGKAILDPQKYLVVMWVEFAFAPTVTQVEAFTVLWLLDSEGAP